MERVTEPHPGDLLESRMKERGWACEDVADVVGCGVSTVRNILTGRSAVSVKFLPLFAAAFDDDFEIWIHANARYCLKDIPPDRLKQLTAGVHERLQRLQAGVRCTCRTQEHAVRFRERQP